MKPKLATNLNLAWRSRSRELYHMDVFNRFSADPLQKYTASSSGCSFFLALPAPPTLQHNNSRERQAPLWLVPVALFFPNRTSSSWQRSCLICKSELGEDNRQRSCHGAWFGDEARRRCRWSPMDMRRGRDLAWIPYLTSVAAGLYRSGVINCSETTTDQASAMMLHRLVL